MHNNICSAYNIKVRLLVNKRTHNPQPVEHASRPAKNRCASPARAYADV